ncbi:hypothetical protein HOY80DRAFT_191450 [Tuber brumale]|nr:hypothetical protein HOY80DRAFT_191450 [Tuber brumale]
MTELDLSYFFLLLRILIMQFHFWVLPKVCFPGFWFKFIQVNLAPLLLLPFPSDICMYRGTLIKAKL